MGLFDFFGGGSIEKQIGKHAARIKKKDAQQEDRIASAYWLAENGSTEAIMALLGRFEMTYEHLMKDSQEKDAVQALVLELGETALPAIEHFLRRSKQFARPLALYQAISGDEKTLELLFEMLTIESKKSELKPDKKKALLIKLAEFQDARAGLKALPFLDDFDEGVRFGAIEVLAAQTETEEIRAGLLGALSNEDEESNRVRVRIAEIAGGRRWPLGETQKYMVENPPSGWTVAKGRLVQG